MANAAEVAATGLQLWGAGGLGAVIGWYVYYINRHRKAEPQLADLATLIGAIAGGTVVALFPAKSEMFGAYGVGLAIGFFSYFLFLVAFVATSKDFTFAWFLDGRATKPDYTTSVPMAGRGGTNVNG